MPASAMLAAQALARDAARQGPVDIEDALTIWRSGGLDAISDDEWSAILAAHRAGRDVLAEAGYSTDDPMIARPEASADPLALDGVPGRHPRLDALLADVTPVE